MARELTFVPARRCYVVRWRGDVTPEESRRHWQALAEDPRYQRGFAALHDVRGCNLQRDFESAKRVRQAYQSYAAHFGEARLAILVDGPRQYGMERQLITMLGFEDLGLVTYDEAEAKAWVGLPADYPLPYEK